MINLFFQKDAIIFIPFSSMVICGLVFRIRLFVIFKAWNFDEGLG